MSTWERERDVAVAAVRRAAEVCRRVQSTIDPASLRKKDRSPVTVADFASQALVGRTLLERFPDDPVIGEEDAATLRDGGTGFLANVAEQTGESEADVLRHVDHGGATEYSPRFWTLDPVDGTKGFLRGEQYAIALALVIDGAVTVAALACPNLPVPGSDESGVVFVAVRGQGATWQPAFAAGTPEPIAISIQGDPAAMRFCESVESGHSAHDQSAEVARRLGIGADPVRLDSQAKYAVVARGDAEIYLRLPTRKDYQEKIWDHAAGMLVVAEAGGVVTDVDGKALDFTHGRLLSQNRGIVVSHGPVHDRILTILREIGV
jgi:3'(2'), 5'-bisphosphate nucleotidase